MNRRQLLVPFLVALCAAAFLSKRGSLVEAAAPYTSSINVRVKDRNVKAVRDADVNLYNAKGQRINWGRTNSNGQIVFSGLPTGIYTVTASKRGVGSGSTRGSLLPGAGPWNANISLR